MKFAIATRIKLQRGFTLIEMMIAIMIFAIISVLAYQAFDGLLRARDRQLTIQAENSDLHRALAILQQDLIHVRPRPIRDQFGDSQPAYQAPTPNFLFELTRGGLPPVAGIEGGLQRVGYRIEDDDQLTRNVWSVIDRDVNAVSTQQFLLSDVSELVIEQLDGLNFWVPNWPPLNQNIPPDQLPRMIRVTLTMNSGDSITRLIPGVEYVPQSQP